MSVINKMLKDLDDRQESADGSPAGQYSSSAAQLSPTASQQKKGLNPIVLLLAGILFVLTVLVWHLVFNQQNSTSNIGQSLQSKMTEQAFEDPAAELVAKPDPSLELEAAPEPELETAEPAFEQPTAILRPDAQQLNRDAARTNTNDADNSRSSMESENEAPAESRIREMGQSERTSRQTPSNSFIRSDEPSSLESTASVPSAQQQQTQPKPQLTIQKTTAQLTPEQHVEKLMTKAEDAYDKGYITEAIEQLTKVLAISDSHIEARNLLAAAWYGRGESARAITIINDGLQRYPMIEAWRLTAAKIFFKENNVGGAFSYLDVELSNASKEFYTLKGNLARELKDFAKAEQAYSELTKMEPNVGSWWLGLAIAQDSQNKAEFALASYKKVMMTGGVSRQSIEFSRQRIAELEG